MPSSRCSGISVRSPKADIRGRLDTIRRILLASAAIPGAFPPTMFDVTLDGVAYQEMHVDGGAFAQAFLYPPGLTRQRRARMAAGEPVVPAVAYIIRNGRLDPEWATTERSTMGIAGRAIATMITVSGLNDVLRIYNTTQHDGIGFNLAYIGPDFTQKLPDAVRPGLHASPVRLRLPACPAGATTGQNSRRCDRSPARPGLNDDRCTISCNDGAIPRKASTEHQDLPPALRVAKGPLPTIADIQTDTPRVAASPKMRAW